MVICENDESIASKIRRIYGNNYPEPKEVNSTGRRRGSTISKMQSRISESGTEFFGETESQQDLLWRFVNLSNEVDDCLLEIACEYLAL